MTETVSPVHDASDQEGCPDSTTIPEHHQIQQTERYVEPNRRDHTADQLSIHGQVTQAVAELEGLSLKIDTFTTGKSEAVEGKSDKDERDTEAGPEPPASPLEDPEEGSQTSSEESWGSFPSSGSCSTDSSSSAGEEGTDEESEPGSGPFMSTAPDAEATFKFHEEFSSSESSHDDVDDNDGSEPPSPTLPPLPPPPPLVEDDEEEEVIYSPPPPPPGPWSVCAVPRWAFLESSDSLPTLGLGPEDFYHGGSSLRHEVSADGDEDEDEDNGSDEDAESRMSQDISSVRVVHL